MKIEKNYRFKNFLMNENKKILNENMHYLSQQVGDILSSLQSLLDDSDGLGNRQIIRAAQSIVNQIRRILSDKWEDESNKILKNLQKIGVAIMKSIDEKEDLRQTISSAVKLLEKNTEKTKEPLNNLGSSNNIDEK